MGDYDRQAHLEKLHNQRRDKTTEQINKAIDKMLKTKQAINFNSVAAEVPCSKATLYNKPEIRQRIEYLRDQQAKVPSPSDIKREMDENNKDAVIASLKRRIKKLEEELKQLRNLAKISYGDIYKKI